MLVAQMHVCVLSHKGYLSSWTLIEKVARSNIRVTSLGCHSEEEQTTRLARVSPVYLTLLLLLFFFSPFSSSLWWKSWNFFLRLRLSHELNIEPSKKLIIWSLPQWSFEDSSSPRTWWYNELQIRIIVSSLPLTSYVILCGFHLLSGLQYS